MESIESLTRHLQELRGGMTAQTLVLMHLLRHSPQAAAALPGLVDHVKAMSLLWVNSTELERTKALELLELMSSTAQEPEQDGRPGGQGPEPNLAVKPPARE